MNGGEIGFGFKAQGAGAIGPRRRNVASILPLRALAELFRQTSGALQVRCGVLDKAGIAGELQTIRDSTSWDGSSCRINDQRDQRPMPEALAATEVRDCPVCHQTSQPEWTWEIPGVGTMVAYAPERPFLPGQLYVPLSKEHKTSLRDLTPEEFIYALIFAKHIINEQISRIPGATSALYIHLGAVGSSIVHPIMILGGIVSNATFPSQNRFALAARYWRSNAPRDVIWEENTGILSGGLQSYYVSKIGGESDPNRGWLVHAPFASATPYHLRVSALREGAFNLGRLEESETVQLGYAIWAAVNLLSQITTDKGKPAINNLAINLEMLPSEAIAGNPKARMHIDIAPQETMLAGMELIGLPVTRNPLSVAERMRSLVGNIRRPLIATLMQLPAFNSGSFSPPARVQALELFGASRAYASSVTFDPAANKHGVRTVRADVTTEVGYQWILPWHGLHTTVIVPEGWSGGFSHIDYTSDRFPQGDTCFADDPQQLGFPHFLVPLKEGGPRLRLVTNAFGFAGGKALANGEDPFAGSDVEVVLGHQIQSLKAAPAHLVTFTPRHITSLEEITPQEIRGLVRGWQQAARLLFGKSPENNRLVCLVNLGVEAGASIPHFHSQLIEVSRETWGTIEKQIALVDAEGKLLLRKGNNPYNLAYGLTLAEEGLSGRDLMAERIGEVKSKGLVLFENTDVVVYVEEAPMSPYEAVIRLKRAGASNVKYLTQKELSSVAKAISLLKDIYVALGVQDMNIIDESAQYDNRTSCWRYGVRFIPRRIHGQVIRIGALNLKGVFPVPVNPLLAVEQMLATLKIA